LANGEFDDISIAIYSEILEYFAMTLYKSIMDKSGRITVVASGSICAKYG